MEDTDDCDENSLCVNTGGNYLCLCNLGYATDDDKNEFYTGFEAAGTDCANLDECQIDKDYNACDGNATCADTQGSYECTCIEGFYGNGLTCIDIQECNDPRTNDCDEGK